MSGVETMRVQARRLSILSLFLASNAWAIAFFPGAEGFGGSFTGTAPANGWFSNASVYHVTTTADTLAPDGKPAVGTLRGAFYDAARKQQNSNVIVVFDVGGTFQLTQGSLDMKTINNMYIAGQTAPSPVTVYGDTTQITHSNNTLNSNVILRYMTFRKGSGNGADAITFAGGPSDGIGSIATNMILDHVSASWSEDENLSVANNNNNVTVQYSVIADSLVNGHAYGSLVRPKIDASVSYHHNLYSSNASRNPRPGTYNACTLTFDFRNNVLYNWRDRASYTGGSSEAEQEYVDVNYVGNYLVAGPSTAANPNGAFMIDKNVDARAYSLGNFVDSDKSLNPAGQPNGADPGVNMFSLVTPVTDQSLTMMPLPFSTASVTTTTANDAYWQTVNYAGNFWWSRDAIDARIVNNVLTNTAPPNGVAATNPDATELNNLLSAPMTSRPAGWDTDGDGMPDAWETSRGLNPNLASDGTLNFDNDGYVNVVEYLNEVGAFPAPTGLVFSGSVNSRFAISDNWTAGWQPSRFDVAKINAGSAVVDAIGQSVGTLLIGVDAGSAGQLQMSSGWLEAYNAVRVGSAGGSTGTLTLTGGTLRSKSLLRIADTGTIQFNGGSVDLTGGIAVFDYSASSPLNFVKNAIQSGSLTSSVLATDSRLALGYAEASALSLPGNLFNGESVDSTTVLVAMTYKGDANLDRKVDSQDFNALLASYGSSGLWSSGNFNNDSAVNTLDFNILAGNFGLTMSGALPGANLGAIVPEPSSLCLLAMMSVARRRRG
jgi:hypothetical protein